MKLVTRPLVTFLTVTALCLQMGGLPGLAQNKPQTVALSVRLRTGLKRERLITRLETLMPRLMRDGDVPGLGIAVIRDSKVLWQRGFGVKNVKTGGPINKTTVFEAASLSKPVFAYAVLKLVDTGKLNLDTPLKEYLTEPYVENDDRLNSITTRTVLDHTTGFPNWRPQGLPLKIYFNPGERFGYSGEGFVYLQKVIEHLTSQPLDKFMKDTVLDPLGMNGSSFVWQDRFEALKATAHDAAGNPTAKRKSLYPNAAATLNTTALDYARFVIAIMNGTGLKKETIKQMLHPQIKVDEGCQNCVDNRPAGRVSPSISWGLGWGLQQTEDGLSFWHWGDNQGDVHCYVVGFPSQKIGVVIFTNSGNGHSIIPAIVSAAIGGRHPAIAWIKYEPYNSPAKKLFKEILARGDEAISGYRKQRTKRSNRFRLTEAQVNRIGYWLVGKKKTKEAIEMFRMNVGDFPNSANVYDSLGEAYMVNGDKELAIRNYEKSVQLNPNNTNGIQMLKKLRDQ